MKAQTNSSPPRLRLSRLRSHLVVMTVVVSMQHLQAQAQAPWCVSPDSVPPGPTHQVPAASSGYAITDTPAQAVSPDPVVMYDPGLSAPRPHVVAIDLTPSTVREGYSYHNAAEALVQLSGGMKVPVTFRLSSSAADEIAPRDVIFEKGQRKLSFELDVNWKMVPRNGSIMIRVFDPKRPDRVVQARLYLIKQIQ